MDKNLDKIIKQLKIKSKSILEEFSKLDKKKKLVVGLVVSFLIVLLFIGLITSKKSSQVVLFSNLSSSDFSEVSKKIEILGFSYWVEDGRTIMVKDSDRDIILTKLAQEDNIPKGIPGWKLFDISSWSTTDKELDIKYMRALRGEIKKHIESLKNIDQASVDIAISKESLYSSKEQPYTAAVTLHLANGYNQLNQKEIKGISYLVSRAVGSKLKPENVTITDAYGKIISDHDDLDFRSKEYSFLEYRAKIEERARASLLHDIRKGLEKIYSSDRIQIVRLNMDFNWDKILEEQEFYSPIELEKDDPSTPYSERKIKDSLIVTEDLVSEKYKGSDSEMDGYLSSSKVKKGIGDQAVEYSREERVVKHVVNKIKKRINKDSYKIAKISVAIAIDGQQELSRLPSGQYDLSPSAEIIKTPLKPEELEKAKNIVKKAINYSKVRGDQVAIENIMFDRTEYWDSLRKAYQNKKKFGKEWLLFILGVFFLLAGFTLFLTKKKKPEKKNRSVFYFKPKRSVKDKLSLEEETRFRVYQNVQDLARKKPSEVAYLLRSWLSEK